MAKFLRIVFNLLLMCYIAAALALFVPPLVGVTTAVTLEGTEGNQELGSVNYAWRTSLKTIQTGDEILVTGDNTVNVYAVKNVDTETSTVTAADAESTQIAVRTYVYKLMLTVPYLGYIAICMQTMEGMIILAAIAGTLLVLCILTAIWCRKRKIKRMKEDEEDLADEENNEFFQNLASQKREADARAEADYRARRDSMNSVSAFDNSQPALDEEYEEFPVQTVQPQVSEVAVPDENQEAFDEEDPQTDIEIKEETAVSSDSSSEQKSLDQEEEKTEASKESLFETSSEAMEVERAVATGNIPGVQAALEAALDTQQIQRHVRRNDVIREPEVEAENLTAEEIELAMPVYTADEYLQKAYAAGEDPVVRKDELTGVTYVDFSECI